MSYLRESLLIQVETCDRGAAQSFTHVAGPSHIAALLPVSSQREHQPYRLVPEMTGS